VKAIQKAFPTLELEEFPVVARFKDPALGRVVIDVMKPADAVYQAVFANSVAVGKTHRVPNLEMALVCKYAAMISPNRHPGKKLIDGGDFYFIVEANGARIRVEKLKTLGDLVYVGGGEEILKLVEDVSAGRRLEF
jgi:hypothetical protein